MSCVRNNAMGETAAEFRCMGGAVGRSGNAVGIAIQRNRRDRDRWLRCQAAFQIGVARIAAGEAAALRAEVDRWRRMGWLRRVFSRGFR